MIATVVNLLNFLSGLLSHTICFNAIYAMYTVNSQYHFVFGDFLKTLCFVPGSNNLPYLDSI